MAAKFPTRKNTEVTAKMPVTSALIIKIINDCLFIISVFDFFIHYLRDKIIFENSSSVRVSEQIPIFTPFSDIEKSV